MGAELVSNSSMTGDRATAAPCSHLTPAFHGLLLAGAQTTRLPEHVRGRRTRARPRASRLDIAASLLDGLLGIDRRGLRRIWVSLVA